MKEVVLGQKNFPLAILVCSLLGFQQPTSGKHSVSTNVLGQTLFPAAQSTGRSRSEGRAEKDLYKAYSADHTQAAHCEASSFRNPLKFLEQHRAVAPLARTWPAASKTWGHQWTTTHGTTALCVDTQALYCWNLPASRIWKNTYLTSVWYVTSVF